MIVRVPKFSLPVIAAIALAFASVSAANAGVAVGPQTNNPVVAEQWRKMHFFEAEYSFQQKLRVGKERYEQKQSNRAKIIAGMAAELQARQQVVVTHPPDYSAGSVDESFNLPSALLPMAGLLAGLVGVRYRINRRAAEELLASKRTLDLEPYLGPIPEPEPAAFIPSKADAILTCKCCGADGRGRCVDHGFMVMKGSVSVERGDSSSLGKAAEELRVKLIESGVVREEGSRIIFREDHVFSSPSLAAAALLGKSANGWLLWKTEEGITLERLERLGRG